MSFPNKIKLVEVSPRDGLQNEAKHVPTEVKIDFINQLSQTGLQVIEVTSFVSPKWVPQLADHKEVFASIKRYPKIAYPVLVPNLKGLEAAIEVGVKEIAVFTTPSEAFSQKNIHCSVAESLERIHTVIESAKKNKLRIRGYLSCVLGCPYEGDISAEKVALLARELYDMGCYEISLGDTIGVGTPFKTKHLLKAVSMYVPMPHLAVHFHDTYGQALANIYAALEEGVAVIDSALAGLGGCPYAKGATGNVATEDVLYMLHGMGIATGVDLKKMISIGRFISAYLGKTPQSKVNLALGNFHSGQN